MDALSRPRVDFLSDQNNKGNRVRNNEKSEHRAHVIEADASDESVRYASWPCADPVLLVLENDAGFPHPRPIPFHFIRERRGLADHHSDVHIFPKRNLSRVTNLVRQKFSRNDGVCRRSLAVECESLVANSAEAFVWFQVERACAVARFVDLLLDKVDVLGIRRGL